MSKPDLHPEPGTPRAPFMLGFAGVVPIAVLALALWVAPEGYGSMAMRWLVVYAAIILSFVGALHWGIALAHPEVSAYDRDLLMGWSVVPALIAWIGVMLEPLFGLLIMAAMFCVQYEADRRLVSRFPLSPWFLKLRAQLTGCVVVCLLIATLRALGA